jgi:ABC-2 type transport system permease protein
MSEPVTDLAVRGHGSVIHDIGYQRYAGPRLGSGYAARSLYGLGLRTAFGIGRGPKAKIFPWITVGIMLLVAIVVAAIRAQVGTVLIGYLYFPGNLGLLLVLFCAVVAPELVSRDLRSGVLPLYFSRPLTRTGYALAKLGALVTALWAVITVPLLVMYLGGVFTVKGAGKVWDETLDFLPGLAHAGIFALVYGALALTVASFVGRRAVAAAIIVAVFLVTTPVVGVLNVVGGETGRQLSYLVSPLTLVDGLGSWLWNMNNVEVGSFGLVYLSAVVALVVACVLVLLERYRKVAR